MAIENKPVGVVQFCFQLVHIPNFFLGGGRVGGLRTCHPPYNPLDFQGKIKNLCHPTLQEIRSKITVIPSPPPQKKGQSQNYGASINFKFTFQNHFEEILGCCNTRYHRIRHLVNKNEDPARLPYYKFKNNVSGQFSNMTQFRP